MNQPLGEGIGCAAIILALGIVLGWAAFVEGAARLIEALK